ncbi:MAG: hypothetical protein ABIS84_12810 [Arachnia sp.]
MSQYETPEPHRPGRRALPADDGGHSGAQEGAARRSTGGDPGPARARRVAVDDGEPDAGNPHRARRWAGVGVLVVLALSLLLWLVMRPAGDVTTVLPPTTMAATPTPTAAAPSPSEAPTSSAAPSATVGSAAPLPATVTPAPAPLESPEPTPGGSEAAGTIVLNDATFTAPSGWLLYGDDVIEDGRRAVRLSNDTTDARLQAVTLNPGDSDLSASCASLVDLQQAQFTEVTRQLVVPIGVDAASGTGVRCGFTGVRASDGVANTVAFTLVSRVADAHVLMLRTTVPQDVESDSPAVQQLGAMSCEASDSFGVTLPLC